MSDSHSRPPRDGGANALRALRDETGGGAGDESLLTVVKGWVRLLRRAKGGESVRETLEDLIEERDDAGAPIDDHEKALLGNILHLRDLTAYDVMVPRADIVGVETDAGLDELIELFCRCGHSRLPVHRGTLDDIIGMVHIKDALTASRVDKPFQKDALTASRVDKPFQMSRIVRRVLFVSPAMRITDLLLEMRLKRTHMALVVDEYGGIDGLVTIEDVVEQIVGEIEDEHDQDAQPELVVRADGVIEADARTPIEEFEHLLGPVLTEEEREEVDTLGGLVFFVAGRIPLRGELIAHPSGLEFEVVDADPRRIKWLRVRRLAGAGGQVDA